MSNLDSYGGSWECTNCDVPSGSEGDNIVVSGRNWTFVPNHTSGFHAVGIAGPGGGTNRPGGNNPIFELTEDQLKKRAEEAKKLPKKERAKLLAKIKQA